MPAEISQEERARLTKKRSTDWLQLVTRNQARLPTGTLFGEGDGGGVAVVVTPGPRLGACSKRQLNWIVDGGVQVGSPSTAGEVVGEFSPTGTAEDFLPTVLQVQYVARLYLTRPEPGSSLYVVYSGGIGDFATHARPPPQSAK
jgi:hypothetical protein